jgi:hypothetical protein
MLSNVWLVSRPLHERLRPGMGALCRLGDFHYPVCLLLYDNNNRRWNVQWWRGCHFLPGGPLRLRDEITCEPEACITDALWGQTMARHNIRVSAPCV